MDRQEMHTKCLYVNLFECGRLEER